MAFTKVLVGRPARKPNVLVSYDISRIIGFSGDIIGSSGRSIKNALAVTKDFSRQEIRVESPDFDDFLGELADRRFSQKPF